LGATIENVRAELERLLPNVTDESGPEPPAYRVGDRVLVHDRNPPYRLWEGRIAKADEPLLEISIPERSAGELVTAELMLIHKIPMTQTRDCPFCRDE
jgi:hypothetical protein